MQNGNSFVSDLKNTYRTGGMTIKLIFINCLVFIGISAFEILGNVVSPLFNSIIYFIVGLSTSPADFIVRPWGIFTYMFSHLGFMHLLMNMLFLYVMGRYFEQFFSSKRLLYTYILGGLFGGVLEIFVHVLFPHMSGTYVIGASGAVMAVMAAIAFYQPQITVSIWGLFNVKIIYIALLFLFSNLYSFGMGADTGTAHLAHLGGMLLGFLSVKNPFSASNIVNRSMVLVGTIQSKLKPKRKKTGHFSYTKSTNTGSTTRAKSDEEYNMEKKQRQARIDAILDKISKSGYESLTTEEKELLFSQSK